MDIKVIVLDSMHAVNFCYWEADSIKIFVIFGVDNSLSVRTDNRKKNILVFAEGPTD